MAARIGDGMLIAGMSAALAACGGGGDGGSTPAPPPPAGTQTCTINYSLAGGVDKTGADPLLDQQWYLNNTGQSGGTAGDDLRVFPAWLTTKGTGVVVAVTDDAIETVHADLRQNVLAGKSYNYRDGSTLPLPCTPDEDHGTSVTGILLARDGNGSGGAGVAPRASLIGFNALSTNLDADGADAMTRQLGIAHLYHNSWGSPDNGFLNNASSAWEAAIQTGLTSGRGGKGAVYVFPAGNGGQIALPTTTGGTNIITENSNFDGYVNKRGITTACAVTDRDESPIYSEPGANILVCGPAQSVDRSDAVTTAINPLGGALDNYRAGFNGTSASTPMVSGVVALMLAVNPNLSWRDVQQVLARSARENSPGDPSWQPSAIAGKRFSHLFGYGVANAQAAIALAGSWSTIGGSGTQLTCGPYGRTPNALIADAPSLAVAGPTLVDALDVTGCPITKIEFVQVTFTSDHPYGGDLDLRLRSPANLTSELANARGCGQNVAASSDPCRSLYSNWRFGSVRHFDEAVNGRWQFEVTDRGPQDVGTFNSWSVTFYGR